MEIQRTGTDFDLVEAMYAASCGNLDILKKAHKSGLDLTHTDYDTKTTLHLSSRGGHMDCVRFLVEEVMVSVGQMDRWGMVPLDYAQNSDMVEYLLEQGEKQDVDKIGKFSSKFLLDEEKTIKKFFT